MKDEFDTLMKLSNATIHIVRVRLFNFIARYLPIQWWAYDGMGGRDRWNKTTWKYVLTGKHRKQRLKLGWA
jgi:hypothetical protein